MFPSNLSVSLDFVSGNIEILGKQNLLSRPGSENESVMNIVTTCLYEVSQAIGYYIKDNCSENYGTPTLAFAKQYHIVFSGYLVILIWCRSAVPRGKRLSLLQVLL